MKKVQVFVTAMFVGFIAFCMVSSANATMVNITSATPYIASGDQTDVPEIEAIIFPLMVSGSIEVYRVTPGNPNTEQFAFAGSYQTTFLPDYLSKEDAKIEYIGGPIISPIAYLLAKDGQGVPGGGDDGWFLYNLTAFGWTGTEDIIIDGLWPNQGSFSHISIYDAPAVPIPGAAYLFGSGLAGLVGIGRWRRRK